MKLRRTGVVFSCINISLILIVAIVEFAVLANGNTSGGWAMIFPFLWNLPSTLLLMPLLSLKLPEWMLLALLVMLGSAQWYFIGHGIEAVMSRRFKR
ncbi:hypothetical protein N9K06_00610 [Omnitrophica bacterium]|nr:hypothetical protein [Candidatus Omnitrophota bacterium]